MTHKLKANPTQNSSYSLSDRNAVCCRISETSMHCLQHLLVAHVGLNISPKTHNALLLPPSCADPGLASLRSGREAIQCPGLAKQLTCPLSELHTCSKKSKSWACFTCSARDAKLKALGRIGHEQCCPTRPQECRTFQEHCESRMSKLGPSAHPPIGPSAHRPIGPSAHRPIGPSAHRPIGPSAHRHWVRHQRASHGQPA